MTTPLQSVLDAVTDAVSAIVLFAGDDNNGNARLTNLQPGMLALSKAIQILITQAKKSAECWASINRFDMQENMYSTCQNVEEAILGLTEAVKELAVSQLDKAPKRKLLKSCKLVMTHTVALVQLSDLYDVQKIISTANNTSRAVRTLVEVQSLSSTSFIEKAGDIMNSASETVRLCYKRIPRIEIVLQPRLKSAADVLRDSSTKLPTVIKDALQIGTDQKNQERDELTKATLDSLNEIIAVTRLSAKSPFDLSMLEGADLLDYPHLTDQDIFNRHQKILYAIEKLTDAWKFGSEEDVAAAKQTLREELMEQARNALLISSDAETRKKLEEASGRIHDLLGKLNELGRNANINEGMKQLEDLMISLRGASAFISQNAARSLLQSSRLRLCAALDELEYVTQRGTAKESVDLLKVITSEIGFQVAASRGIVEEQGIEPLQRTQILTVADFLDACPGELVMLSKAVLVDPSNEEAIGQLLIKTNETNDASRKLVLHATNNPKGALLEAAGVLNQDALELEELVKHNNLQADNLAHAVRNLAKDAGFQANLANEIGANIDPANKQRIATHAVLLKQDTGKVVIATKALLGNTDDEKSKEALQSALHAVKLANLKLVEMALGKAAASEMRNLEAEVIYRLNRTDKAVKQGTDEELEQSLKVLQGVVDKQLLLAQAVSGGILDRIQEQQIEHAVKELCSKHSQLKPTIYTVRTGNSKVAYKALEKHISDLKVAVSSLSNACFNSKEDRLLNSSKLIVSHLNTIACSAESQYVDEAFTEMRRCLPLHLELVREIAFDLHENKENLVVGLCDVLQSDYEQLIGAQQIDNARILELTERMKKTLLDINIHAISSPEQVAVEKAKYLKLEIERFRQSKSDSEVARSAFNQSHNLAIQQGMITEIVHSSLTQNLLLEEKSACLCRSLENVSREMIEAQKTTLEGGEVHGIMSRLDELNKDLVSLCTTILVQKQLQQEETERIKREQEEKKQREQEMEEERKRLEEQRRIEEEKIRIELEKKRKQEELDALRLEQERLEKLKVEKEQIEAARRIELERIEAEKRLEELRLDAERAEAARLAAIPKEEAVFEAARTVGERVARVAVNMSTDTLFDAAKGIGKLMEQLSIAAHTKDKAEMIRIAREISNLAKIISKKSEEQATKCKEPVLKNNLLAAAQNVSNISVQLKIIAAVKASSEDDAKSAKMQLVICAQGLAKSVVAVVDAAEVAMIRSK